MRSSRTFSWQDDLDSVLNVDTPCATRQQLSLSLLKQLDEIKSDVISALKEKDLNKIAPEHSQYGQALRKMNMFAQQLASDILPNTLIKSVPRLIEEAPRIASKVRSTAEMNTNSSEWARRGQDALQSLQDTIRDPAALRATLEVCLRELRNVIKSSPEGVQSLPYETLHQWDAVQLRRYALYAVCTAPLHSKDGLLSTVESPIEALLLSDGYRKLSAYFAQQNGAKKLAPTAPVITNDSSISFVLPDGLLAAQSPLPSDDLVLQDVAPHAAAAIEFSGLATQNEIRRQRALLEEQLIAKGISFDNTSFEVFQYNPLHTLPWLRKNEVVVHVNLQP